MFSWTEITFIAFPNFKYLFVLDRMFCDQLMIDVM